MTRWVTLAQLADETGLVTRTLMHIRDKEPGVLVTRQKGKALEYSQPACAVNLRKREGEKALASQRTEAVDEAKERARKMRADAERSELHTARLRGDLVLAADFDAAIERLAVAVRDEVRGLRPRFTMLILGLSDPTEAAQVLDNMAKQILGGLAKAAIPDDDDEPLQAAA